MTELAIHSSVSHLLKYFEHEHLPPFLKRVSIPFCELAWNLVVEHELKGPELTVALRKLLEAKDCAVRAKLDSMNKDE